MGPADAAPERGREGVRFVLQVLFNRVVTHMPSRRARRAWLRLMGVRIAGDACVFTGTTILGASRISIGPRSQVGWGCLLDGRGEAEIGEDVVVASGSVIVTADHDVADPDFAVRYGRVRLERHSWLGTDAMVLRGVTVGYGAVVAARSVATRDVPRLTIVAGSPARTIGERPDGLRYRLGAVPRLY